METNKVKIYKDIACLEIYSTDGGKWWYAGGSLAFTPILVEEIHRMRFGQLRDSGREVLAVGILVEGREKLIALNIPRTDINALKARGLWPKHMKEPYTKICYSNYPDLAVNHYGHLNKSIISLR